MIECRRDVGSSEILVVVATMAVMQKRKQDDDHEGRMVLILVMTVGVQAPLYPKPETQTWLALNPKPLNP